LKGLEITELRLSKVRQENRVFRFDTQFFGKEAIATERTLKSQRWETLGQVSTRIESFGAYALTNEFSYVEEGIPFLRCVNIKSGVADLADCLFISPEAHKLLSKSAVESEMVLLTMSGSVGEAAVALPGWKYPVNSNQDVAKITTRDGVSPYFIAAFLNSRYGRIQAERLPIGSVQQHIFLWMLEQLVIVRRFSEKFESAVARAVQSAYRERESANEFMTCAEETLIAALGLGNWQPPEPLAYTRRALEAFAAKRLDSQYFAPRVEQLITRLSASGSTVRGVAPPRRENFFPSSHGEFRYIEISDLHSDGTASCTTIAMSDAPSRATQFVRTGDVLTSTVRPNRRLSAIVSPEQDGCVASSGFVVLQPSAVPAEVLLTYLRLPLFCELMDLHTSASLYPAISERDLLALPFPKISKPTCDKIVSTVRSAHTARAHARELLDRAKRAVELAIEKNEAAGMELLKGK
jgi:hypothetical protein